MKHWPLALAVTFGVLGSPVPAAAQEPPSARASAVARLDSATAAQVAAIAAGARSRGLPTAPIVAKARLGALRHAPDSLIVAAAKAVAERLALARAALEPRPVPGDVAAGADALSAGATPEALRLIRTSSGGRPIAVPLGVLAELTATGVAPVHAATIITSLMRRGAPPRQLVALGNDVNADVRAGARAEASLGVRLKRLEAILPTHPALPAATVPSAVGKGGGG